MRAHSLIWLHNMVGDLASISHMVADGRPLAPTTVMQWQRIMTKLSLPSGLPSVIRRSDPLWAALLNAVLDHAPRQDPIHLRTIANNAFDEARKQKERQSAENARSWASFAEKQV